jgi:CheY-like chemotaxis protein
VLGEAGYRVDHAADGKQALEQMARRKTPDLLITDLIMPEVEGIETITRMRRIAPRLKIIAMSGSMEDIYLDTARVLGANATFPKPLQLDALLTAVRDLLHPDATTIA